MKRKYFSRLAALSCTTLMQTAANVTSLMPRCTRADATHCSWHTPGHCSSGSVLLLHPPIIRVSPLPRVRFQPAALLSPRCGLSIEDVDHAFSIRGFAMADSVNLGTAASATAVRTSTSAGPAAAPACGSPAG